MRSLLFKFKFCYFYLLLSQVDDVYIYYVVERLQI